MTDPFSYETAQDGDATCVRVYGELDMSGTMRLEQELERVLGERPDRLVIDLSGATFVDSTGMNLLITTDESAREEGVAVEMVPGPREVMRVFETTGLVDVLPFRGGR